MSRFMVAGLGLVVGCSAGISEIEVEDGVVPGVAKVSFSAKKAGTAKVLYSLSGTDETFETPVAASAADHDITVLGLRAGRKYDVWVEYENNGGNAKTSEVVEFTVQPPDDTMPVFQVETWEPDKSCMDGGHVLFSYFGDDISGTAIIDRDAQYVWTRKNDVEGGQVARPRPGRDGASILWNYADADRADDIAGIVRYSIDGETRIDTRTLNGHHDFVELPDGRMAWLGFDFRDTDVEGYDEPIPVAVDTIHIDDEGVSDTATTETLFNVFDHYEIFDHGKDFEIDKFLPGYHEFTHGNSLVYLESEDNFYGMWRWIDELVKIDGQTGEPIWQLGGPNNEFAGIEADLFDYSHFSDGWADQVLIYDNRQVNGENTRLRQYTVDEDAMTYELTWDYESDRQDRILGDVRRMPFDDCDNVLVSFTNQGRLVELTRDGETVWSVATTLGAVTSRAYFLPDLYDFTGIAYPQ